MWNDEEIKLSGRLTHVRFRVFLSQRSQAAMVVSTVYECVMFIHEQQRARTTHLSNPRACQLSVLVPSSRRVIC